MKKVLVALIVCTCVAGVVSAETIEFSDIADTVVFQGNPDTNYGSADGMTVGFLSNSRLRGLVRFDLTDFSGSGNADFDDYTINSVKLEVYSNLAPTVNGFVNSLALQSCDTNWIETEATYNEARNGVQWNNDTSSSPGAGAVSLGGFSWTSEDEVGEKYTITFGGTGSELKALLESWASPTNPGLLLAGADSEGVKITLATRESGAMVTPTLIVDYTVPEPATIALLCGGGLMAVLRRRKAA